MNVLVHVLPDVFVQFCVHEGALFVCVCSDSVSKSSWPVPLAWFYVFCCFFGLYRTENAEMQVNKDKVRQDQQLLYRDNERLIKRVDNLERYGTNCAWKHVTCFVQGWIS